MKITKGIQSMAKNFGAEKNIRPNLAGILFKENKAVATNSFKLMEVEFEDNNFITNEDIVFKNFIHFKADDEAMISTQNIISLKLPKVKNIKLLDGKLLIGNVEKETASINYYDGINEIRLNVKTIENNFPKYETFFGNDNIATTGIGVEEMIELLQTYKAFGIRNLKMQVGTALQPIQFECNGYQPEGIKSIKSILMPIKL